MSTGAVELVRMRELVNGGQVRQVRVSAGLSLAEVGREVGVCPSTVFYWERGRIPRGEAAVRYARLIMQLIALSERVTP